ncbi:MAG: M48 family metalloprotease [Planctomycetota bacterium]
MPTADLDAVLAVLPAWVRIGAYFLVPLLVGLAGWLAIWLAARCAPVDGGDLHWTEFARRRAAAQILLHKQIAVGICLPLAMTAQFAGELATGWTGVRLLIVGLSLWLASRGIVWRHGFRTQLGWSRRDFRRSTVLQMVALLGPTLAGVLAIDGPNVASLGIPGCVAFYGVAMVLVAWSMLSGPRSVPRWLGLVTPADARLRSLVAAVAQRTSHAVRAAWILHTREANAYALPRSNELFVTSGALAGLTDAELTAILLHKVGHLRESRRDQRRRLVVVAPWLVLAAWQPLAEAFDWRVPAALLAAALVLVAKITRLLRQLEVAADDHAKDHLHATEAGDHARALEHLYRLNLYPAAQHDKHRTHPDLYDRMLAAGVTPDFPRPEPPQPSRARTIVSTTLTLLVLLGVAVPSMWVKADLADLRESEARATFAVMFAGDPESVGVLGYHWLADRPGDAAVLLTYASAQSKNPEYPAWLAMALAGRDPDAAQAALEQAEQRLAQRRYGPWQRSVVAAARESVRRKAPSEGR